MKKPRKDSRRRADPVVTEIVRNGVLAVTEEMKTNLMRTAYNIIIYEALDFTTGLFTPRGETISIGIGLPMFIRGMAETVKAKIRHFGADGIKIRCAGRLGGAELARVEKYHWGRVPLHTLRANIDYGFAEANTTFGVIGIKVWIYRGDIMDPREAMMKR